MDCRFELFLDISGISPEFTDIDLFHDFSFLYMYFVQYGIYSNLEILLVFRSAIKGETLHLASIDYSVAVSTVCQDVLGIV